MHRLLEFVANQPPLVTLRRWRYARRFARPLGHAFSGVYSTFEAAVAALPPTLPGSYDCTAAAGMYVGRRAIDDFDYPVLYWLLSAFVGGARTVCDLGGGTGHKFHAYRQVLEMPGKLLWRVVEVPAAAALGAQIAAEEGVTELAFSADPDDVAADVLLASGALQYLPRTLSQILSESGARPQRIVVNTTPIHPTTTYFTRNNIGVACCAYRVMDRTRFVQELAALGYSLIAEWRNPGKRLDLPFEPALSLPHYTGFCFERAGHAGLPRQLTGSSLG